MLVILLLLFLVQQSKCSAPAQPAIIDGDPLYNLTAKHIPEQIIDYTAFRVSFNPKTHIPNWVAWELTADEVNGDEPRTNTFAADPNIEGCALPDDYRHSGYDRGHMAPAGDMKWSPKAMKESFLLTNICPQAKVLNTGAWRKLEEKCRQWAIRDSAIYIVCGPVPGDTPIAHIGINSVEVPKRFFKAIIAPYANPPRGIAFIMPNGEVPGGIQTTATSIDQVEQITGHDLFALLPTDLQQNIESQSNFNQWSHR